MGVQADIAVYPEADHGVSSAMLNESLAFLEGIVVGNAKRYGSGLARGALYYGSSVSVATKP
jgi:hypothetical protein